jgi:hypothetical protein
MRVADGSVMGSRWARVARGLLASSAAIFVAALFHVSGGGSAPSPVALALSLAFATLASITLTARRLSLWRLTASVTLSQVLFHLLFSLGGGTARFSAAGELTGLSHLHSGSHLVMTAGDAAAAHADMSALPSTPGMWFAHASAILVTVLALRFGERAFWGLFETARLGVARLSARILAFGMLLSPAVDGLPRSVVRVEPSGLRDLGIPLGRLRHRGPPRLLIAH